MEKYTFLKKNKKEKEKKGVSVLTFGIKVHVRKRNAEKTTKQVQQ